MFSALEQCLKRLIKRLYSPRCYFCKSLSYSNNICLTCFDKIEYIKPHPIKIIEGVEVYSAGKYDGNLRRFLKDFKFKHRKNFSSDIAIYMNKQLKRLNLTGNYEIVPVPMFYLKEWVRQYNHMDLIGVELSKNSGYKLNLDLVERIKNTKPQYKLTKAQRDKNLRDAFKINIENYNNKGILLIDDVVTTGSTLKEIIKTLKEKGIEDIKVLVASSR